MEKKKMNQYEWQQGNLTVERQREILEKRREYLLQLMPDDISANAGSTDTKLIEEWCALQLHRDKLLHSQIDKDNKRSLDSCYLNLLHMLETVGSYNHCATPQPMKQALSTLYWELKKYFSDVDIENTSLNIDTSLILGTPTRPSPQRRKNKRTKLNKPDLIPSAYRSPKRYKPGAQTPSTVVLPVDRTPLLPHTQSSSEWESADESYCSIDVTDLDTSTYSTYTDASTTPVCALDVETSNVTPDVQNPPRTPLAHTPLNVSFNHDKDGLVTPKSTRAPNFGRTPVSTRTPLIRGVTPNTAVQHISQSKQKATPHKKTPYKVARTVSLNKRRKISEAETDDSVLDMDTEQGGMGDVLSTENLQAELQKEDIVNVDSSTEQETNRPLPAPHIVNTHDKAVAKALQKTFQNYKRGGVYTSPVKIDSATEKEESFNISID